MLIERKKDTEIKKEKDIKKEGMKERNNKTISYRRHVEDVILKDRVDTIYATADLSERNIK
jgi:hypothetical protein